MWDLLLLTFGRCRRSPDVCVGVDLVEFTPRQVRFWLVSAYRSLPWCPEFADRWLEVRSRTTALVELLPEEAIVTTIASLDFIPLERSDIRSRQRESMQDYLIFSVSCDNTAALLRQILTRCTIYCTVPWSTPSPFIA